MTLPKLLFACMTKGVVITAGKRGRIRFNPRSEVSGAMKQAIAEHKPALLELLRDGDIESWRMVRLDKPEADRPPEDDSGDYLDADYEPDVDLAERLWCEEQERERDSVAYRDGDDLVPDRPFVVSSPDDDDDFLF